MTNILIVDDSSAHLYAISQLLESDGYNVVTAQSGEEGVEKAQQSRPDLILMDIVMPGMSGFQATRELSKSNDTKEIPIIYVTTKDQETDKIWGMRQGAVAYLTKPVDGKLLLKSIKAALH